MENNKKNNSLIIVILTIALLLAIGYIIFDKVFVKKENNINVINISEEKIKQIYTDDIKHYLSEPDIRINFNSTSFSSEDEKMEWILGTTSLKKLEFIPEYCNTDLETQLINEGFIGALNEGELNCSNVSFVKGASTIELVKQVFGKNSVFDFNKLVDYPYVNSLDLIMVYKSGLSEPVVDKYIGYTIKDNILTISFSITNINNETSNHEAKYLIDGDNYYIKSINRA